MPDPAPSQPLPPEHPVLLREIVERPDDDEPRLRYADWCAEIGETERAEFIRMQVKATALKRQDKRSLEGARLRRTAWAISQMRGAAWSARLGSVQERGYHRGFVASITIDATAFIEQGAALCAAAPIQHLKPTVAWTAFPKLFACEALHGIRSLQLGRSHVDDQALGQLAASPHLRHLRWLDLSNNDITEAGVHALAASRTLPNLRFVDLTFNPASDPCEQFAYDQGMVVASEIPDFGRTLIARYGDIPWLHRDYVKTHEDLPPRIYDF